MSSNEPDCPFAPPHRAGPTRTPIDYRDAYILALGIAAWVLFIVPPVAIAAWLVGRAELRRLYRGRGASASIPFVRAAYLLGLVMCALQLVSLIVGVVYALALIVERAGR